MNANGRRARQARMGYTHIDEMKRPKYKKRSALASARRLAQVKATEQRIKQSKGKKK